LTARSLNAAGYFLIVGILIAHTSQEERVSLSPCVRKSIATSKVEIGVRRASAAQELARLAEQQRVLEQAALETASLVDYCARVRENLKRGFSMEEKRLALSALNITVYWYPDGPLEIHGSIPIDFAYSTSGCAGCNIPFTLVA
jgi:hypothetical protein